MSTKAKPVNGANGARTKAGRKSKPIEFPTEVALRLKAARFWRGIGIRELERQTLLRGFHVSRGTISDLEQGRQGRVEMETARRLALAMDIPPKWLMCGDEVDCPIPEDDMGVITMAIQRGDKSCPPLPSQATASGSQ